MLKLLKAVADPPHQQIATDSWRVAMGCKRPILGIGTGGQSWILPTIILARLATMKPRPGGARTPKQFR